MRKLLTVTLTAASLLSLAGCATTSKNEMHANGGMIVKKFKGPVIASDLLGPTTASTLGDTMNQQDLMQIQTAIATGQPNSWTNSTTNNHYQVTPGPLTYQMNNNTCREYKLQATIQGRVDTVYGSACQQMDGSWQTINH